MSELLIYFFWFLGIFSLGLGIYGGIRIRRTKRRIKKGEIFCIEDNYYASEKTVYRSKAQKSKPREVSQKNDEIILSIESEQYLN